MRQRYADRKEQYRAYNLAHRAQRLVLARKSNLKRYGLTLEAYAELERAQGGACAICGGKRKRRLAVDHDHATGRVRGLLCDNCNMGVGKFQDSSELLQKAISYLARHAH